jgi:hypothetical protein
MRLFKKRHLFSYILYWILLYFEILNNKLFLITLNKNNLIIKQKYFILYIYNYWIVKYSRINRIIIETVFYHLKI